MKRFLLLTFSILFIFNLNASYQDFDCYQETISRKDVEDKITKYLQHDEALGAYYTITNEALMLFASPEDKEHDKVEFILRFGSKSKPTVEPFSPSLASDKPFSKLRVAIDPGHLGGNMCRVEERCIDIELPDKYYTRLQFDEGTLASSTAMVLKALLKKLGADVFVTREVPGKSVYALSFAEWCKKEFGITEDKDWLVEATQKRILAYLSTIKLSPPSKKELEERLANMKHLGSEDKVGAVRQALFRLCYNILDLEARAAKINEFNPHLTIVIHYNGHGGRSDIATSDYCLAFIPGSIMKGELACERTRYEFIRLLVTNDIEESLRFSAAMVKSMEEVLQVPLMKFTSYLGDVCRFVDTGIYSRNLFLTRLVHSPLCYGETLIQNYPQEAIRLANKDAEFNGEPISFRVLEVALAYFRGICNYFNVQQQGSE